MSRILLSAYACEPGRGSEPEVGWGWAVELARQGHEVTVITRTSNFRAIEERTPRLLVIPGFVYYDLPTWVQRCRRIPGGKHLYYILWQWFAVGHVRRLFPDLPFDVVQHVTYVSARYPSFMGSLGIPFLFGPVSGGESVPPRLRSGFSAGQRIREWIRDVSNSFVPLDPFMRRTFRQARKILVTRDSVTLVPRRLRHKLAIRLAVGLSERKLLSVNFIRNKQSCGLRLLYVGRLLEWKGVHIAVDAVGCIRRSHPDVTLTIIGDGPAKAKLERLVSDRRLERNVQWLPWLPQRDLDEHYRAAHLLLFPSLRDSGGMVVLEALAAGIPVFCTDLGGPGLIVNASCGRTMTTLGRSPQQLAQEMANAVIEVIDSPSHLEKLGRGAKARAAEFTFTSLVQSVYPKPVVKLMAKKA